MECCDTCSKYERCPQSDECCPKCENYDDCMYGGDESIKENLDEDEEEWE
ncbi:MAG: hypothetical protein ABII25_00755 [bacterium]